MPQIHKDRPPTYEPAPVAALVAQEAVQPPESAPGAEPAKPSPRPRARKGSAR